MVYLREFLVFLGKRIAGTVAIMFGVVVIIFLLSHALSADPAQLWAGAKAHASEVEAIKLRYHLEDPLYVQFYYFLVDTFTLNFGIDPVTGQSISSEILFYAPNTVELVVAALIITVLLGVVLGYLAAMHFSTKVDSLIRIFYLTSWATPYYLGAIAAILIFAEYLPILPSGGMFSLTLNPPHAYTGIFLIDSLISLNFGDFASGLQHLILPAGVLALLDFGILTRVTRSSMLDVRWSTPVKFALARGVPENTANMRHIFRNGLIDANTVSAIVFGWMLSGTVIVEEIFAWPGIGDFADKAIVTNDYPALIPVVIFFTFGVIVANFLADVIYSFLDPRIALGSGE